MRILYLCMLVVFLFPPVVLANEETLFHITAQIGDWTPPNVVLNSVIDNLEYPVSVEYVTNATFSDGLQAWTSMGNVITDQDGAQIGDALSPYLLRDQSISQVIAGPIQMLTVRFRGYTVETLEGFDDPAFLITVNDDPVYQLSSAEFTGDWQTVTIPTWQYGSIPLQINLYAGNAGDNEYPSWVEIQHVTSNIVAVSPSSYVRMHASDDIPTTTFISFMDKQYPESEFFLTSLLPAEQWSTIEYWATNSDGVESVHMPQRIWNSSIDRSPIIEKTQCVDGVCRSSVLCSPTEMTHLIQVVEPLPELDQHQFSLCRSPFYFDQKINNFSIVDPAGQKSIVTVGVGQ